MMPQARARRDPVSQVLSENWLNGHCQRFKQHFSLLG
jgi:hypothetical protein